MKKKILLVILILGAILLDQGIKALICNYEELNFSIFNIIQITYVKNTGVAFGLR